MKKILYDSEVKELLTSCNLPVDDLQSGSDVKLFGLRDNGVLIGVVGIEKCGEAGLLRSLAVSSIHRGKHIGQKLVAYAESWAAANGLKELYLLTTTADTFFQKIGYSELPRDAAPLPIAATKEFSYLCPSSSVFMHKSISAINSQKPSKIDNNK
ncbi:MAG: arsenic resistance N-acetyltransferase ArsN2 [Balneolales bacterium]|nr:arsenic resistance N-acetyltransferase ArsN2 [Balneolales bacterium]